MVAGHLADVEVGGRMVVEDGKSSKDTSTGAEPVLMDGRARATFHMVALKSATNARTSAWGRFAWLR